jgi:hypothetical protein
MISNVDFFRKLHSINHKLPGVLLPFWKVSVERRRGSAVRLQSKTGENYDDFDFSAYAQ